MDHVGRDEPSQPSLVLDLGTPVAVDHERGVRKAHVGDSLMRLKMRLCLHGSSGWGRGTSWRAEDVFATYRALPDGVRAALRVAAQSGCVCDVGSHTSRPRSKYEARKTLATVRGEVPGHVAVALTLAGFRRRTAYERGVVQWWGWSP